MIRAIVVLAILLRFSTPMVAQQASWVWVNPYPTGAQINQLYFKSPMEGFLLGNTGTLMKTTDAGNTWRQTGTAPTISSMKMFFATPLVGYAIGMGQFSGSFLLRTSNGGNTWADQALPSFRTPRDIFFLNASAGWIVGEDGLVLQTTDGGATWQDRSIVGTSPPSFYFVRFSSVSDGIALGRSFAFSPAFTVGRSSDGGNTWALQTSGLQNFMSTADQLPGNLIVSAGTGGLIIRSVDLGQNWSFPMGLPTGDLAAMDFQDSLLGIAVGSLGRVSRTTNGGLAWNEILAGISHPLTSVQFVSRDSVLAGGSGTGFPSIGPAILLSTDGGLIWTNKARSIEEQFQVTAISLYGRGRCWIVGDRFIYGTADTGLTWRQLRSTTNDVFRDVLAMDSLNGVAVGSRLGQGLILRTTNAGNPWLAQTFGNTPSFYRVAFPSPDTGYAVGESGVIVKTTNRGQSWFSLTSGTTNSLLSMKFITTETGWVASGNAVLRTTNGGQTWTTHPASQDPIQAISFPTSSTGYAAAFSSLYKTTDGGLSWSTLLFSQFGIQDIAFTDANKGWIIAFDGVSSTSNGGSTWTNESPPTGVSRFGLLPGEEIWAGGGSTSVMRSVGGTVVGVSEKPSRVIPNAFSLKQNYPNPFNPTTMIVYEIPRATRVVLTVFDILGREVTRLVDEVKPPGSYQATWDAAGLASGTYFYRLEAGEFNEVKHLLLLK